MTSKTPRAHETAEHESEPASPIASENLAVDASVKSENPVFPIVGIGASAGGLEAYTQLLRALPADTGMAFVLVQHLAPEHESMLAEILARATAMPVTEVHDEPRVQPNCVYVIPPNRTMLLTEGHLKLVPRAEIRGQHRSIDSFLRSLARDQHHHAIGVILSGTGSDGTLGLEAIKAEGGITFAQDETAQHTGMPRSAVAAGCADYVLPAEAIASELIRIGRHPYVAPADATTDATSVDALAQSDVNKILQLLRNATGVDFRLYKSTTLYRRITRRMLLHRLAGFTEYHRFLERSTSELQALYQDILISVTAFFRDPASFENIRSKVLARLFADRSRTDPLRVWVLGCSTGEEAYSLAITIAEFAAEQGLPVPAQVFATDLNEHGIERARAGQYAKNIAQDVSPERLRRFFVETDGGYQVTKAVREMCVFARQNALADPPFSRMDLISCRNLLIYMEPVLQKRIVPMLHYALKPGGYLWLGSSEAVGGFAELFEPVDSKHKVFARRPGPVNASSVPLAAAAWEPSGYPRPRRRRAEEGGTELLREADRVALARYSPPGVLVSAELEIVQFRGDTTPYLAQAPGKPSTNVLKMAREGLLVGLRAALQKAGKESTAVRQDGVLVKANGGFREINLDVLPLRGGGAEERGFLILFEDAAAMKAGAKADFAVHAPLPLDVDLAERQVAGLTQELAATREFMQSLVEQQEAANEEMQSANEEIQSTNEELQSVNEELQTSKEEIQSSNEELSTVNDELRRRNEQLDRAHNDLNNLVASSHLAMVVVGTDLRIRRFSPAAEKLLNLITADLGRPIEDLKLPLFSPDLEARLAEVIDTVSPKEQEVQDRKGRWYSLRIRPYKTLDNKIDGAVLVLVEIEEQKRVQEELRASEEKYRLLVDGASGVAIMLLDDSGRVTGWNLGAERIFGYTEAEIMGEHFSRFFIPEDVAAGKPEQELDRARHGAEISDDHWLKGKDGNRFWASAVATAMKDGAGRLRGFSKVVRDITELNRTERALHESEVRLKAALVAAQMGTWVWHFAEDRLILDESLHDLMGFPPGKVGAGLAGFLAGVHSADRTAVRVAFERSASQGVELDVEFRVKSQDGTFRWVRDRGKVIPGTKSLPGYLTGACVDITEQRSAEESLREADRKKDEFLATLAHELRNPLAPLSNVLEILSRTGGDISSFHEGREIMDRQVRKLTRLVDDLLDVARIRQGKIELRKELVDLSSLVPQALESVRHYIDAGGHTLTVSVPEEPVELHGDAVRLEQVIANLLHNAAKYTDPGGEITLSLVTVNPGTEFSTGDAVLSVRDTGVGIAPELLDRIFDFFVRADVSYSRNASGLGIGLSLVKSLVENHGGRVEAKSAGLGQGSEFVVRLPLRPEAKAKEAKATRKGQEPKPDVRRILVVDDNVDSAQSGARLLRLFGHEVQTAFNGPDALEAMSVFRPEVVLLDIGMPGMDGYEVARQIRSQARFDTVALVALSGYGSEDDRARARKAGFDRHLIKPVDYDALAKLLAALKAAAL